MKRESVLLRVVLFVVVILMGASQVSADEDPLPFDIYQRDSCLAVWLDLSVCLTGNVMERLEDGIDLVLECRLKLLTPRRFLWNRQVSEKIEPLRISYERLTKTYVVSQAERPLSEKLRFASMADLFRFTRDSVEICVARIDSLDSERRYQLDAKVTAISLTDLNLTADGDRDETEQSPVNYLFEQFLDLTSYGRREYEVRSHLFPLKEIESGP